MAAVVVSVSRPQYTRGSPVVSPSLTIHYLILQWKRHPEQLVTTVNNVDKVKGKKYIFKKLCHGNNCYTPDQYA